MCIFAAENSNQEHMIQSMTGYGKASAEFGGKKIVAEIKSLNSKALDLSVRIAPIYREKEMEVRQMVAAKLERGKIEMNIWTENEESASAQPINQSVFAAYVEQLRQLSETQGIEMPTGGHLMQIVLRMPDVMTKTENPVLTDEEWQVARGVVEEAIDKLVEFRTQEGIALARKFEEKLTNIENLLHSIEPYETERVERIRARIMDGLAAIPNAQYDSNRLEQEMIYYIEKLDISEEKQRLANHLKYFRETMEEEAGQGKKLGFIAQEMGREINTTGSKSNHAEMQNIVVKMKDELEQIKEQVLNAL